MSWDSDEPTVGKAVIKLRGSEVEVDAGADFKTTVFNVAKSQSLGNFDVKLNGVILTETEAPSLIATGDVIELTYYGKLAF